MADFKFILGFVDITFFTMASMQVLLTRFTRPITREEREAELKKLSSVVSQQLSQSQVAPKEAAVVKKRLGRPRKPVPETSETSEQVPNDSINNVSVKKKRGRPCRLPQVTLIPTSIPSKCTVASQTKKRGRYENWFTVDKWPLIAAAVKQHRSISGALHYLKIAHRFVVQACFISKL